VRRTDGGGEVPLETYARLQSPEAMPQAVLRRMVRGVSTRDYAYVIDLARDGFGVQKSSVSRDFVRASAAQVKALAERRFDGTHFPVILIDGVEYAGETMIVAAGITADGTKRVLGLRQGATENATVCVALLEDLQVRGLNTSQPALLLLDGAKALHAAAKRVWGQNGVIQRCQVHKKRNVKAHVPEKHHAELERRLSEAYHETRYEAAKASLEATARWLERINPDAASSLREGLEETLAVDRAQTLASGGRPRNRVRAIIAGPPCICIRAAGCGCSRVFVGADHGRWRPFPAALGSGRGPDAVDAGVEMWPPTSVRQFIMKKSKNTPKNLIRLEAIPLHHPASGLYR
jgi:hypothetical protein